MRCADGPRHPAVDLLAVGELSGDHGHALKGRGHDISLADENLGELDEHAPSQVKVRAEGGGLHAEAVGDPPPYEHHPERGRAAAGVVAVEEGDVAQARSVGVVPAAVHVGDDAADVPREVGLGVLDPVGLTALVGGAHLRPAGRDGVVLGDQDLVERTGGGAGEERVPDDETKRMRDRVCVCVCVCVDSPAHELLVVVGDEPGLADVLPEGHALPLMSKGGAGVGLRLEEQLQLGREQVVEVGVGAGVQVRVHVHELGVNAGRVKEHGLRVVRVGLEIREQGGDEVNLLVRVDVDGVVVELKKPARLVLAEGAPRGGPRGGGGVVVGVVGRVKDPAAAREEMM